MYLKIIIEQRLLVNALLANVSVIRIYILILKLSTKIHNQDVKNSNIITIEIKFFVVHIDYFTI